MNDNFEIPVTYKGEEHIFSASLITSCYTYKIQAGYMESWFTLNQTKKEVSGVMERYFG